MTFENLSSKIPQNVGHDSSASKSLGILIYRFLLCMIVYSIPEVKEGFQVASLGHLARQSLKNNKGTVGRVLV